MISILIGEDDHKLNDGILFALQSDNVRFHQCYNCKEIRALLGSEKIDLVILDVNFPDGNGIDLLKEMGGKNMASRVILLTANNMETDIVMGLELGAKDYITKPFSLMVLRARVRVQLREIEKLLEKEQLPNENKTYSDGIYSFDFQKMRFTMNEKEVVLSKTEQKLLRILIDNKGRTVTRENLIDEVWDGEIEYVDLHALIVAVKRLRDKLGDNSDDCQKIKNIYGIGYTWVSE